MTVTLPTLSAASNRAAPTIADWTCPFCALLCEGLQVVVDNGLPRLEGTDCPRALAALSALQPAADGTTGGGAWIDGRPAETHDAIRAAAHRLAGWRQPLFSGLGTDVAGARALYRLAAQTEAICDHADGETLMQGVRAVQDRGQFITTLAELRSRAELIVCIGTPASARYPEFFRRAGLGQAGSPCRELVFLGVPVPGGLPAGVSTQHLPGGRELANSLQQLAALVGQQRLRTPDPALARLAEALLASPYSVLVWEAATLPAEGSLLIEMINRIVGTLNRTTRSASLALGGSDGAHGVNQTFTWLSGLPLRTRISPSGLAHEPRAFGTRRLLAQHAVDGLLWISSFDPDRLPPETPLPRIVLGPPAMSARLQAGASNDCVFIPVATPGFNADGHLFRTDGPVVLPLSGVRDDTLPGVAQVLAQVAAHSAASAP